MQQTPGGKNNRIGNPAVGYWLLAALMFGVLALAVIRPWKEKKDLAPEVVILGDSIYGEYREPDSIAGLLEENTGRKVFNGALGGTCLARRDVLRHMDHTEDGLSMAALAKSVVAGDFSVQQLIHLSADATWYFDSVIDEAERVDFDRVKLLIVGYGLNDYHAGVPLEDPEDPTNEYTFGGALRSVLGQLKDRYPRLRILLVTPTYTWYSQMGMTCEEYDGGGGVLEDYVAVEQRIAEEFGVELLDLYHDFTPHESGESWDTYTRDGVHPNEAGRARIARALADYLEENP